MMAIMSHFSLQRPPTAFNFGNYFQPADGDVLCLIALRDAVGPHGSQRR